MENSRAIRDTAAVGQPTYTWTYTSRKRGGPISGPGRVNLGTVFAGSSGGISPVTDQRRRAIILRLGGAVLA
jgi:hypothetical protein